MRYFLIATLLTFSVFMSSCSTTTTPSDNNVVTPSDSIALDLDKPYTSAGTGTDGVYDIAFFADGRIVIVDRITKESQMLESSNGGSSWNKGFKFLSNQAVNCIAVQPQSPFLVFCGQETISAAGRYYLLTTNADAISQTKDLFGNPGGAIEYDFEQAVWNKDNSIVATLGTVDKNNGEFVISPVGGVGTWQVRQPSSHPNYCGGLAIAGDTMYVGVSEVNGSSVDGYVAMTGDKGVSWKRYSPLPASGTPTSIATGTNHSLVFSYGTKHYFIKDGMTSWKKLSLPTAYSSLNIRKVAFDSQNKLWFVGDLGVYRTKSPL